MAARCLCNELPTAAQRWAEDVVADVLGLFPLVNAFELLAPAEVASPWFVRVRLGGLWLAVAVEEDEKTAEGVRAATLSLLVPTRDERERRRGAQGGTAGPPRGRQRLVCERS